VLRFALLVFGSPEAFANGTAPKPTPTLVLGGPTTSRCWRPASTFAGDPLSIFVSSPRFTARFRVWR
jgi:hypothetical protein